MEHRGLEIGYWGSVIGYRLSEGEVPSEKACGDGAVFGRGVAMGEEKFAGASAMHGRRRTGSAAPWGGGALDWLFLLHLAPGGGKWAPRGRIALPGFGSPYWLLGAFWRFFWGCYPEGKLPPLVAIGRWPRKRFRQNS